jgi:uncharacterized membrane protein YgaE (UPF0421/DUF939 family)
MPSCVNIEIIFRNKLKRVDFFQMSYFTTLVPLGIVIAFLVKVIPLQGAVDGLLHVLNITPYEVLGEKVAKVRFLDLHAAFVYS